MINPHSRNRSVLAAAIGAVLLFGTVAHADAQERGARHAQRETKKVTKDVERYPEATRTSPESVASAKGGRSLNKLLELYDAEKGAEARVLADEVLAAEKTNAYDKAFAARMAGQIAYEADDSATAIAYFNKALELNGLDNNTHYNVMLMVGQLQMQDEQYAQALATFERYFAETKSHDPDDLALKGNVLYRLERYPEAADALKQAIAAAPEAKPSWTELLLVTYFESGRTAEAMALAEQLAASNPDDKQTQMNLASTYLQADAYDKAAAVLEKLHVGGKLTDDKDYRQLFQTYLNIDGREKDAARVIAEGLQKGILKPEYGTYRMLAQAYYFSDQYDLAIDAYSKAAPLAPDGETYLDLARTLWQEDRIPEAKAAAKQAIGKGLKKPDDAKKILALPGG